MTRRLPDTAAGSEDGTRLLVYESMAVSGRLMLAREQAPADDGRIAALERLVAQQGERIAALEARLIPRRHDATALRTVLAERYPGGVEFTTREVFDFAQRDTAEGLTLRAELVAARVKILLTKPRFSWLPRWEASGTAS